MKVVTSTKTPIPANKPVPPLTSLEILTRLRWSADHRLTQLESIKMACWTIAGLLIAWVAMFIIWAVLSYQAAQAAANRVHIRF